jgi:hypothetical protein
MTRNTLIRSFTVSTLILAAGFATGCSTPAYSGKERFQTIGRNISNDAGIMQDEIDNALMLRPSTLNGGPYGWNYAKR